MNNPADLARHLLDTLDRATMATTMADGSPYASLVLLAMAADGTPLLLLSDLAEHTRNLAGEPRAALLLDGTAGLDEPLTGPRLTLLGRVVRSTDQADAEQYLARHPGASLYAGFADFRFHRLVVERVHLVAGFGRIHWLDAAALARGV
jgi:putative heme iron utilization protein